jgi:hypothetical protein
MDVARDGDSLTLSYRLSGKKRFLAAAEVADAANDASAVSDDNYWYLDLTSTAGGTNGSKPDEPLTWAGLIVGVLAAIGALALAALAVFGVRQGLHADDGYAARGVFYPVTIRKFLAMNVATGGLYAFFWMWKCWRWLHLQERRRIEPFWRSLFGVFWLYPLFSEARRRGRLPLILRAAGLASGGAYILWAIAAAGLDLAGGHQALAVALTASSFLCLLPTVAAVNRLNAAQGDVILQNSRYSALTSAALVCGVLNWAALASLPLAPLPANATGVKFGLTETVWRVSSF